MKNEYWKGSRSESWQGLRSRWARNCEVLNFLTFLSAFLNLRRLSSHFTIQISQISSLRISGEWKFIFMSYEVALVVGFVGFVLHKRHFWGFEWIEMWNLTTRQQPFSCSFPALCTRTTQSLKAILTQANCKLVNKWGLNTDKLCWLWSQFAINNNGVVE